MKIYVNDIDAAWSYIHDVILDCFSDDLDEDMLKVMDDDDKAREISRDIMAEIFNEDIINSGRHWGFADTCVKDNMWICIDEHKEKVLSVISKYKLKTKREQLMSIIKKGNSINCSLDDTELLTYLKYLRNAENVISHGLILFGRIAITDLACRINRIENIMIARKQMNEWNPKLEYSDIKLYEEE